MAIAKNISTDKQLTARMLLTGFFIVVLYSIVIAILVAVGVSAVMVVFISFAMIFGQYWFSDRLALWGMGGRIVTEAEAPELHAMINRLCALADMPKPIVAIADTDVPNAFATGRSPKRAVVCATTGIMRRLDEPEMEAVLAHELSHVAHRDVAIMTFASSLGMLAGLVTRMVLWSGMMGGSRDDEEGGGGAGAELLIFVFSIAIYFISFLLTQALSRYRELAADRSGALLTGKPTVLASALIKITGEMGRIPTSDLRQSQAFNAFFFTPALNGREGLSVSNLFATHPTLERRLAQLDDLERQLHGA
jgi:heat shock protein HtpX